VPFALPLPYVAGMLVWLVGLLIGAVVLWLLHRRWSAAPAWRRVCARVGLAVWVLLAALTAAELAVAIAWDESDSFNCTNVSRHWWARHVQPDIKTLTFKDGESILYRDVTALPKEVADGQRLICVVGDSFALGYGVPHAADRLSDRLGASLEARRPGRFLVRNLSDVGRGIDWIAWLVGELIDDRLPVQTVIYVLCLNDIEPFNTRPDELSAELRAIRPQSFLLTRTYFINLLYYRAHMASSRNIGGYYDFLAEAYVADSPAWLAMRGELDAIRQRCASAGLDFRVVVFPFLHQLGEGYRFAEAHRLVVEWCDRAGVPVLDLRPVLEPHAREGLTVNRFDSHPNERAHALAAVAIERELLDDLAGH
jgi:hypothetical protein